MYDTGNPKPAVCDNLKEWEDECGREGVHEGGDIGCMPNVGSC